MNAERDKNSEKQQAADHSEQGVARKSEHAPVFSINSYNLSIRPSSESPAHLEWHEKNRRRAFFGVK